MTKYAVSVIFLASLDINYILILIDCLGGKFPNNCTWRRNKIKTLWFNLIVNRNGLRIKNV